MLSSTDKIFKWVSSDIVTLFLAVVSDQSCYTCDKCIVSDYEHCLHTEHTGQKRLLRPVEEPSNNADNEDNFERSINSLRVANETSAISLISILIHVV
jgi:hypothetical protein